MKSAARRAPEIAAPEPLQDVDARLLELTGAHVDDGDFWSLKERDRSDSGHCLFQYPAMMVPLVQRRLLRTVLEAQPQVCSLYDPFVGSGTSLVSGMHFGLSVFGNDVNPLAVLISRVRTARTVEFTIGAICEEVARRASADRSAKVETSMANREKWFKATVVLELSRLRRAIRRCDDLWVRRFLWVTLAETVRLTSNDRTSTYKLHTRSSEEIARRDLSPIEVFRTLSVEGVASFTAFRRALRDAGRINARSRYTTSTEVRLADTRDDLASVWRGEAPFDLLMTSPPYGDNQTTVTYGQHSYLPLNWIDLADIDEDRADDWLRTTQEIDQRSLGGRAARPPEAADALFEASPSLLRFAELLPSDRADAMSRLRRFYIDFSSSLDSAVSLLRPNGYMVWTVGNRSLAGKQVPTDKVLGELLAANNCKVVTTLTRRIHHKRMPDRNASSATMREEKILLARKLES